MVRQIAARLLVRQVMALGCQIRLDNGQPSLQLPRKPRPGTQELIPKLKEYRQEVVSYIESLRGGLCPVCRSDLVDAEDRERLAGVNFLCSRGVTIPPKPWLNQPGYVGCPYRVQEQLSVQP